ncbi:rab GTPase-activating protein 1-like isoform X2 [Mytilus trossulus]|uniref:rab GTPase-activating protein 1-like isoform X2 n=1 Tax=Mytilus trossulus TaxID=6551 RepID=UPI003004F416
MEDTVSRSSLDSSSTGDEYVVVNGEPKLRITGDIRDINDEILDRMASSSTLTSTDSLNKEPENDFNEHHAIQSSQSVDELSSKLQQQNAARERSVSLPATSLEETDTVFNGVTYLGCALVNAPRSEVEIYRNMAILNEQTQMVIPIILSVPNTSIGNIRLIDPTNDSEIANYKIHRILFCARGPNESNEKKCFAFTCSHGDSADNAIFQCHVFRCEIQEAVGKILYCFATTFRKVPKEMKESKIMLDEEFVSTFSVSLEFKEDDGKNNLTTCPKDKNIFKFRSNYEKKIVINVSQTGDTELMIERCFGLLISPGRNVKHADMQLIEMKSMGYTDGKNYLVSGSWDPTEECFLVLNTETPKDTRVFLTVAVDLVIHGIQEPVRFAIETKAKIFPMTERFWNFTKRPHQELFHINLKQSDDGMFDVVSVNSQTQIDRQKAGMSLQGLNTTRQKIPDDITTPQDPEEESDGDEPLLSGYGFVSKEITDEDLLQAWHEVLKKWHQNLTQKPKQVHHLVKKGIPEALRGEVWQLLAGCHDNSDLLEAYRVLITKDSPNEDVIQRDINRTFPAHDFFKETGGLGQDSLYRISKAYSVYDEEIGYVQGISFVAASLLLHMPEEQAFSVLIKICFDYKVRELFKPGFEDLHLKFYQLERLMEDHIPDLFEHFTEMGLEIHMFASQWFLTLFTAKFPLHLVFHILDMFLSEGSTFLMGVAVALLKCSRKDLLALDFEGILKFFRVSLPKKYRGDTAAKELIQASINAKVKTNKLKKYEKEYLAMKEQLLQQENPVEKFERENQRLLDANMRLEQENDDLAHEMVESKLKLGSELDKPEIEKDPLEQYKDQCEELSSELVVTKKLLKDIQEEKQRLEVESSQVKEMCRRELEKSEADGKRNAVIIADYKQICSQLSERLEKQQTANKEEIGRIKGQVKSCDNCSKMFKDDGKIQLPEPKVDPDSLNPKYLDLHAQIRELELELAQTKLALVESECKTQDLTHQLNSTITELQSSKNTWFQKTINSLKEVTNHNTKKDPKD